LTRKTVAGFRRALPVVVGCTGVDCARISAESRSFDQRGVASCEV
jgi:hypothetical protein